MLADWRKNKGTHWKKVVSDPNYIGEADFERGEEKVVTIKRINQKETVTTAEGKSTRPSCILKRPESSP